MPEIYENYTAFQNANQDYLTYGQDFSTMNYGLGLSPYNSSADSQGSASIASPLSISSSPHHSSYITLNNAVVLGEPHIVIVEQPIEKFRFRYKSEMMGTHGSLLGANSTANRKKHAPTVQLNGFPGHAVIRCTLVTSDEDQRIPHAHRLVKREGNIDKDDPHDVEVSAENGYTASFYGMGIIHTAKKHIREELVRKMRQDAIEKLKAKNSNATLSIREEAQIKADAEVYQKCMNLNSVALCFQAFTLNNSNVMIPITQPVYSHVINNLKSALTGELKICRIDKYTSSCEGGEEVFILVEKVGKKNIKIKFFELNNDDHEVWADYGRFSELDVHHQYAIAFRTPPYKDLNITSPKEVYIQLERPSDADVSDAIKFTYKPSDKNIGRKRARMSNSSSIELAHRMSLFNRSFDENDSQEITKILSEGCSSKDYTDFCANIDLGKYAELLGNSEEGRLVCDGPRAKKGNQDDVVFAKRIVMDAIAIIRIKPKNMKEQLINLFKDRSTYGDSPLHSALRHGQDNLAKCLLMLMSSDPEYKVFANVQNSSGKTPLHYAVLQNMPDIAKALLMVDADPNTCDDHGLSPLHCAVKIPEAGECVDILLSEKVTNVEAHNDAGRTALQLAAEAGSLHAVHSLIKAGVDVNNIDMSYGRTALHIAVEGGHKEIVEFLLKNTKIDVNKRNFSGNTALHSAVVNPGSRAKEICKLLMEHGADPYIQNHNREPTPPEKQKNQTVGVKIEVDSDEEVAEESGETSFDLASNKPEILQLLTSRSDNDQRMDEACAISTKQETIDDDLDRNWLNSQQQTDLAEILDKTNGWEALAKRLNIKFLVHSFLQSTTSPSILLLNYIDIQGGTSLSQLYDLLKEIGEEEAAVFVDQCFHINKQ